MCPKFKCDGRLVAAITIVAAPTDREFWQFLGAFCSWQRLLTTSVRRKFQSVPSSPCSEIQFMHFLMRSHQILTTMHSNAYTDLPHPCSARTAAQPAGLIGCAVLVLRLEERRLACDTCTYQCSGPRLRTAERCIRLPWYLGSIKLMALAIIRLESI